MEYYDPVRRCVVEKDPETGEIAEVKRVEVVQKPAPVAEPEELNPTPQASKEELAFDAAIAAGLGLTGKAGSSEAEDETKFDDVAEENPYEDGDKLLSGKCKVLMAYTAASAIIGALLLFFLTGEIFYDFYYDNYFAMDEETRELVSQVPDVAAGWIVIMDVFVLGIASIVLWVIDAKRGYRTGVYWFYVIISVLVGMMLGAQGLLPLLCGATTAPPAIRNLKRLDDDKTGADIALAVLSSIALVVAVGLFAAGVAAAV